MQLDNVALPPYCQSKKAPMHSLLPCVFTGKPDMLPTGFPGIVSTRAQTITSKLTPPYSITFIYIPLCCNTLVILCIPLTSLDYPWANCDMPPTAWLVVEDDSLHAPPALHPALCRKCQIVPVLTAPTIELHKARRVVCDNVPLAATTLGACCSIMQARMCAPTRVGIPAGRIKKKRDRKDDVQTPTEASVLGLCKKHTSEATRVFESGSHLSTHKQTRKILK